MNPTITIACNFHDEHNALPGFLEMAQRFADDILLVDCSHGAKPSTDGSREIIGKWGMPEPQTWDLNEGFGAVRSRLLQEAKTDWCIIMDADERLYCEAPILMCAGEDRYPANPNPNLTVTRIQGMYDQRALLLDKIKEADRLGFMAVRMRRRHWFDFTQTRPCENFSTIADYQMRCMKARATIGYTVFPKMHERAWDYGNSREPDYVADHQLYGPHFDHYHLAFKRMEVEQRQADIAAYDALHHSDTHTPVDA